MDLSANANRRLSGRATHVRLTAGVKGEIMYISYIYYIVYIHYIYYIHDIYYIYMGLQTCFNQPRKQSRRSDVTQPLKKSTRHPKNLKPIKFQDCFGAKKHGGRTGCIGKHRGKTGKRKLGARWEGVRNGEGAEKGAKVPTNMRRRSSSVYVILRTFFVPERSGGKANRRQVALKACGRPPKVAHPPQLRTPDCRRRCEDIECMTTLNA